MTRARRASETRRSLLVALALASALPACRQTVILDPSERGDGGAGAGANDATTEATGEVTGTGGAGGNRPDGGGLGGTFGLGGNRDGGRFDVPTCFGQIQQLSITLRSADVIIAVDRSAGMQTWFGDGTRLGVIQDQVLALVFKYQSSIRFGYEEFPSSRTMCGNGQGCCGGEVTPPTPGNLSAIAHEIANCESNGSGCVQGQRPLADALSKCARTFNALTNTGRGRYLLVLTGGEPSCGGSADGGTSACESAAKEVTNLNRDEEVKTVIFGVGDEATGSACLDDLAVRGGLPATGKSSAYRLALTPTELSQALSSFVGTTAAEACRIDVNSPVADPSRVSLLIGNMNVPIDGVDGWTFDSGSNLKITVHGSWCNTLVQQMSQMGRRAVELVSGCTPPHL